MPDTDQSADQTTFTFGSTPNTSTSTPFTFTSPLTTSYDTMSESGYFDDPSSSTSDSLAPTSLFAQLAQRQFDQQRVSQAEYDDPSAWRTRRSSTASRRTEQRRRSRREEEEESEYSYTTDSSHDRALQKEWEEQLDQLKLMFQIIIFPFVGKFFGRKFGYFLFNRYKTFGSPLAAGFWRGAAQAA